MHYLNRERKRLLDNRLIEEESAILAELSALRGKIAFDVPMARHTTMHVGGPAFCLYQPDSVKDLIDAVRLCKLKKISFLAIGSGSNIIIKERGTKKFLIKLSSPFFKRIEICRTDIACGGGVLLNELIHTAESNSLGGSEFLVGIPGTVGGSIMQNAGAHLGSISDIIKDVKILDRDGNARLLKRSQISFGYRSCSLDGAIIIGAIFSLKKSNKKNIKEKIAAYIEKRLSAQDYTAPSAGCIFKNPEGCKMSAGELIDRCGLKGAKIGGACISAKHANFILNKKNATAADVLRLIEFIKDKVRQRFGIMLEEEVKIIE